MRIFWSILTAAAFVAPVAAVGAQNPVSAAAQAVSNTSKAVGRGAKAGVKAVGSETHHALKTTGRGIKQSVKDARGDTMPKTWKERHHKPGGLNKVARDVSSGIKHVGRSAKAGVHGAADSTHRALQTTGNDVKASAKKP